MNAYLKETGASPAETRGEIVNTEGGMLGEHDGVHHFTVGQRRGLGIAAGEPLYVIATDPQSQRVIVGTNDDLLCPRFFVQGHQLDLDPRPDRPAPRRSEDPQQAHRRPRHPAPRRRPRGSNLRRPAARRNSRPGRRLLRRRPSPRRRLDSRIGLLACPRRAELARFLCAQPTEIRVPSPRPPFFSSFSASLRLGGEFSFPLRAEPQPLRIRKHRRLDRRPRPSRFEDPLPQPLAEHRRNLRRVPVPRQVHMLMRIREKIVQHVLHVMAAAVCGFPVRPLRNRRRIRVLRRPQPAPGHELAHLEVRFVAPVFRLPVEQRQEAVPLYRFGNRHPRRRQ